MFKSIKAIPTEYNGRKFRSRLEARWAVFFDTAKIKFEYEAEGFKLGRINYLPDFYLPDLDCFIEIKGAGISEKDEKKAEQLAKLSKKNVYVFTGQKALENYIDLVSGDACTGYDNSVVYFGEHGSWDNWQFFCKCIICKSVGIEYCGWSDRLKCGCSRSYDKVDTTYFFVYPAQQALSAQFEFNK